MLILEYLEVEIDYCTNCSGTWLDQGELELLLEASPGQIDLSDIVLKSKGWRRCPRCRKKMIKTRFPGTKTEVDICPRDGGIWLDKGELFKIAKSHTSNESFNKVKEFFEDLFGQEIDQEGGVI